MELTNDFEVALPVEETWAVLTDVERIAPCLPGAQLKEIEGDEYRGIVKVKVGPITAQYTGAAHFERKDDEAHVAVLKADGRDTRGQGNANATITASLTPAGAGTKVEVLTDLHVTGKVAQFGRGVMADVSAKLLGQFVDNLHTMLEADQAAPAPEPAAAASVEAAPEPAAEPAAAASATGPSEPGAPTIRRIDHAEPTPVDLLDTAGAPVLKRLVPTIAVIVVLVLVWRWLRGRGDR
jgi:uncharacterized protein